MLEPLEELVDAMDGLLDDFPAFRQADVRFHIGLAEATGERAADDLGDRGAGADERPDRATSPTPPRCSSWSNAQHGRLVAAVRERDVARATSTITEHLRGTEHVLAGLLP